MSDGCHRLQSERAVNGMVALQLQPKSFQEKNETFCLPFFGNSGQMRSFNPKPSV
jgi:hypothetical protein